MSSLVDHRWATDHPAWDDASLTTVLGPRTDWAPSTDDAGGPGRGRAARWAKIAAAGAVTVAVVVGGLHATTPTGSSRHAIGHAATPTPPQHPSPQHPSPSPRPRSPATESEIEAEPASMVWDSDRAVAVMGDGTTIAVGTPGDHLVLGDWDCDTIATPALYRPSDGRLWVFPDWGDDTGIRAVAVDRRDVPHGVLEVRPGSDCGDEPVVVPPTSP